MVPSVDVDTFLAEAGQFQLGGLPTEQPHPRTAALTHLAHDDVAGGLRLLRSVDDDALAAVAASPALGAAVADTLASGRRVFLAGCGATGRLSLTLEVLWRQTHGDDRVVAFMAGGDLALVHSIESFEDMPSFGARQLDELGFDDGDLLIACTEGGETPWVIGATLRAAERSSRAPWFLYCNPDDALRGIERCRRVLDDARVQKLPLVVGPMALSGSTRMQASTVLQLVVGAALFREDPVGPLRARLAAVDVDALAAFVLDEATTYDRGGHVSYEADRYGITILTDTTERAPTFSLRKFESRGAQEEPSWSFFHLLDTKDAPDAWRRLLLRAPRPLQWPEVARVAGVERLMAFDFSDDGAVDRLQRARPQSTFRIVRDGHAAVWTLGGGGQPTRTAHVHVGGLTLLQEHLLLKMLLNAHSTLVMARMGRTERNLMTYVRPSNKKLIDRVVRYVRLLLAGDGYPVPPYDDVARAVFAAMPTLGADEPIVVKVRDALRR